MKTHVHKITADRKALTRTIKNSPLLDEYRKSNWISEFNVWFENYFKEKKRPDWRKASTRKEVLLKLVETGCQGDVKKISRRMLECVEIDSMFSRRHNLTSLLIEAGLVYDQETIKKYSQEGLFENEKAYPWEIEMFMQYNDVDMRKYIHRWTLFKKFGKNVNEISNEEIATLEEKAYRELGIKRIFGKSPKPRNRFELLVEMGVCYSKEDIQAFQKIGDFGDEKIYPWDIKNFEILSDKKMLVAACRQFIQKCKINLSEFVQGHILKNGFGQCIRYLRPNVIYNFLTYADCIYSESEIEKMVRYSEFFENNSKLFPWQILSCPQSVYQNENLAVAALIWVAIKSNKPIRLVSKNDLKKYMLRTLFKYHDFANIKARATEKIKILEGEKRISANKIGGIVMF